MRVYPSALIFNPKPLLGFVLLWLFLSCGFQVKEEELVLAPVSSCRPCDPCFEKTYFAEDQSTGPGPIGLEQKNSPPGLDVYAASSGCPGFSFYQLHGVASGNGLIDVSWASTRYAPPSTEAGFMQAIVDALNTTGTACYTLVTNGIFPKIRAEYTAGETFGINIFERFFDCGEVAATDGWSFGVSADTATDYSCTEAGDDPEAPYDLGTCSAPSNVLHGSM